MSPPAPDVVSRTLHRRHRLTEQAATAATGLAAGRYGVFRQVKVGRFSAKNQAILAAISDHYWWFKADAPNRCGRLS